MKSPETRFKQLFYLLILTLAYFVAGRLGLLMAVPPGYATAVWPPSGIAFAALFVGGVRLWPAVMLGSFLVNISNAAPGQWFQGIVPASLIAMGAAAQAAAGVGLVRRFVRETDLLDRPRDILSFIILGGPISCTVNASVGILTLVATGAIRPESAPFSWWTWWVGDSIGVLIFTPVVIAYLRKTPLWRARRMTVALPVMIGFGVMVGVFALMMHGESRRIRSSFESEAKVTTQRFGSFLGDHFENLISVQSFYAASKSVERDEFKAFTKRLLDSHPALTAMEWCPRVKAKDRSAFESSVRAEGFGDFMIKQLDDQSRLVPVTERDEYVPITYIEPFEGANLNAFGFDFNSEDLRRQAMWRSMKTGKISLTAPLKLIQDPSVAGFVVFLPIYQNDSSEKTIDTALGVATEIISMRRVSEVFSREHHFKGLYLYVEDVTDPDKPRPILSWDFSQNTILSDAEDAVRKGARGIGFEVLTELGGRRWRLAAYPTPDHVIAQQDWTMWTVLAGGVLFIGLLAATLLIFSGRESVIRQTVKDRTREIEAISRLQKTILTAAGSSVISTSTDGTITSFNAAAEKILGYSAEEMVGRATPEIFHDPDEVVRRAEEFSMELGERILPGFEVFVAKSRKNLPNTHEWTYVRKDGEKVPVLLSVTALRDANGQIDGFLGIATDLTEQKKAEAERSGLLKILEESPDFIGTSDLEGNLKFHNRAAKALVGLPPEADMAGLKIADMHPKWAAQLVLEKGLAAIRDKGYWEAETALLDKKGREIPVLQTLFVVRDNYDRPAYLATIMRDISDRKQKEAALATMAERQISINHELERQRTAALNLMQDALQDKARLKERETQLELSNRELEQFAYIASHDLQEPLRMVASYTQLLDKKYHDKLDDTAREYIAFAVDGAVRMRRLIEDLLSYSRVQTQGGVFSKVNLAEVFDRVRHNLALAISDKKAEVTNDPLPIVTADETQMSQLLQNLLTNALKFCKADTAARVHVSVAAQEKEWLIGVTDNGIGIEPQHLKKIFIIFKRLHTASEYSGTGIGLAVCQRIVERHGGRIWAESTPGSGTTFYFTLPKNLKP